MASSDTLLRAQAERFAQSLAWPGRATAAPTARALTPAEQARFAAGETQYAGTCAGCHQARGTGLAGVAKPLVGSQWVLGTPARLVRIVLHGKEGEMLMPPLGGALTDEQIANVLTYVRRSWGNTASPISPTDVAEIRGATQGRNKPWTEAELRRVGR
jgi:mono/diheme cytochrome c family protein